jgi:hypothetical protein
MPLWKYLELRKRLVDYLKKKEEQHQSQKTEQERQAKPQSGFRMPQFKIPKFK